MGNGRARLVAMVRAVAPACGSAAMLIGAASALAAGASAVGGHGHGPTRRPQLVVDTRGPRGLAEPLAPFAAGDVQQRTISLRARRRMPIAAAALTVIAPGASSALRRNGFEVRVDRCSRRWSLTAGGGLLCAGRVRTVLGWSAAQGRVTSRAIGRIRAGATAFLRVSLRLPADAAVDQEGRSLRLRYRFTAA
jgi:hypothetical protein